MYYYLAVFSSSGSIVRKPSRHCFHCFCRIIAKMGLWFNIGLAVFAATG